MCEALLDEGVEYLFGYPGGAIMPFYDALPDYPLKHVLVRHEQAAAHAADGCARATGRVGVCVATSGPGATNIVTGLATAQMDSVPLVAITGQVGRPAMGKDSFQETNVMGMTLPFTKHSFLVEDPDELSPAMRRAFEIARSGRPVVTTLLGISAFPEDHPLYLGWPGMHGQASVNRAIARSDLLLSVGMRFDDRITGAAHKFAPRAKIIHIDVDPSELGKVITPTVGIAADAKAAMRSILGHLGNAPDAGEGCEQWREELQRSQEPERRRKESARDEYGPIQVMEAIKAAAGPDLRLVTDVGQHQMWAAQFFE